MTAKRIGTAMSPVKYRPASVAVPRTATYAQHTATNAQEQFPITYFVRSENGHSTGAKYLRGHNAVCPIAA